MFIDKINEDIKLAMREKRADDLSTLRMLLTALKNKKIELGNKEELKDEEAMAVVKSEIKKRKDSIQAYNDGVRQDLADKEQAEIDILSKYMPEQMSEADVEKIVDEVISGIENASKANFGQIMGEVMKKTKGEADGGVVSAIVNKKLS
ncbi:hypothetical protein C0583_05385 [Candidatus Parcubacteria bacterium]|nr:MAG: hypothetical protein C0583_05385 [Candidatus Parcubacteria bacterium]